MNCVDVDPELFFDEHQEAAARKVCAACPAIAGCLDYALDSGFAYGVYGGLTAAQRRPLRRARWAG